MLGERLLLRLGLVPRPLQIRAPVCCRHPSSVGKGGSPGPVYAQPWSRSAAWAVRFRRCRSARCCRKRGGRQIGDHLEKHFADFGISRPLSGLSALLGMAQIVGGFRTHGAASVDVHSGNLTHVGDAASLSPTLCLGSATLCKIGTLLVTFGGQCCISATAAADLTST